MSNLPPSPETNIAPPEEIERRFLFESLPDDVLPSYESHIYQAYILHGDNGALRVRDEAGELTLTLKKAATGSGSALKRPEIDVPITREKFDEFCRVMEGDINKTRLYVDYKGYMLHCDIFHGSLEGLRIVEVEFATDAEADAFAPPAWFGPEITHSKGFGNVSLAIKGLPQ